MDSPLLEQGFAQTTVGHILEQHFVVELCVLCPKELRDGLFLSLGHFAKCVVVKYAPAIQLLFLRLGKIGRYRPGTLVYHNALPPPYLFM